MQTVGSRKSIRPNEQQKKERNAPNQNIILDGIGEVIVCVVWWRTRMIYVQIHIYVQYWCWNMSSSVILVLIYPYTV